MGVGSSSARSPQSRGFVSNLGISKVRCSGVLAEIADRILDVTLNIFEESNHMPVWEEPDAHYEVVNPFSTTSPTDSLRTLGGKSPIESIGLSQFAVDDYGVCDSRASR